jgi:hypothetical protein
VEESLADSKNDEGVNAAADKSQQEGGQERRT